MCGRKWRLCHLKNLHLRIIYFMHNIRNIGIPGKERARVSALYLRQKIKADGIAQYVNGDSRRYVYSCNKVNQSPVVSFATPFLFNETFLRRTKFRVWKILESLKPSLTWKSVVHHG